MRKTGLLLALLAAVGCGGSEPSQEPPAGHARMAAALQEILRDTAETNPYMGDGRARELREVEQRLGAQVTNRTRLLLYAHLGEAELTLGREREAITYFQTAYRLMPQVDDPQLRVRLALRLGVARMRQAETENCCERWTPESCIFPLRGKALHEHREGSEAALEMFREVLSIAPPASLSHLEARWLLNIAHMTLGSYPDAVPKEHRLPPSTLQSEVSFPRFPSIADQAGIDTFSLAGGAAAEDFDNDGYVDLLVSTWNPAGQIRFWRNARDGTFEDRTEAAGLTGLLGGLNMVHADFDNDGDVDVFVLRGAWIGPGGRHPNSLLRNDGGRFLDVTFEAGLGEVHYPTQTAAWADYDNDGDVDLYVGNETTPDPTNGNGGKGISAVPLLRAPCQLFRNNGDGTFTDVAAQAGVLNERFTKAVHWGDYDGDRLPDLYVSNFKEPNRLYHNNGDGTFTDKAPALGVTQPDYSFPAWFFDYDNDGHLDLYVSEYSIGVADLMARALGEARPREGPRLYRGDGKGGFLDVTQRVGLDDPVAPMGANFGDLDNDGFLDFYLGTGYPDYKQLMPNVMYLNRGGRSFADVTTAGGFGHLQKGHAIVFADLDNDGDQEVFEQMGGAMAGDSFRDALYLNPGFENRWVAVRLVGKRSNRSAIGARIRVDIVEHGKRRSIFKHVNSGGTFGASPLRQTIGLGKASRIERLEVFWPTTGRTQTFEGVAMDRFYRIVEGEKSYTTVELETLPLGN